MNLPKIDDLKGKVVVLTGGAGVLGEVFAHALAKANAKVAILDINYDKALEIQNEIVAMGYFAKAIKCNVLNKESLVQARSLILENYGKIDILINGAGGNNPKGTTDQVFYEDSTQINDVKTFFDLDAEGISFVFDLNFLGTLLPTQVFAKEMVKNGGSILNISSMNAFTPLTKIPAYSAAKAAVSNFTKWLSVHFSKVNIRVNEISPVFLLTKQKVMLVLTLKAFVGKQQS